MADPIPEKPISLTTSKKKPRVVETEVKTGLEDIPSKIDLIPPERLSAEFKSAKELESDIQYFFKTFPKQLATIKKNYQKAKKILNWKPKHSLDELIKDMISEEK